MSQRLGHHPAKLPAASHSHLDTPSSVPCRKSGRRLAGHAVCKKGLEMETKEISADPLNRIWRFFTSVKLTVVLLLTLAATSVIGTLIPQNKNPMEYQQAFGDFLYRLFDVLGLFDMYHSWWFQLLMLLLTINVVVCSVDRLTSSWKIIFVKNPRFNLDRFKNNKNRVLANDSRAPAEIRKTAEPLLKRKYSYHRLEEDSDGFVIFAEKWRWTRLGVYIVHTSVVLMLIGGLIGSIFGFEGFVNIPERESVGSIRLLNGEQSLPLPFEIQNDDFSVTFYESGMPKEFRSSLRIIEQGQTVMQKDIVVNDPLRYRGVNIFQSSYGELPRQNLAAVPDAVDLVFVSKNTGMEYKKKALIGEEVEIPENLGRLVLGEFKQAFNFRGRDLGAALVGTLTQTDGSAVEIILPLRFPSFDRMSPMFTPGRSDAVFISVSDVQSAALPAEKRYFTGLQVTKDPGVWVVYTGFILMIIGCIVTFFMSHQRICVQVVAEGSKSRIMVAGTANKNKMGMQRNVQHLAESLVDSGRQN
jgi:cytochrome c biogenesis protein